MAADKRFADLEISDYLTVLEEKGKLEDLKFADLQRNHRIQAYDGAGQLLAEWPVFRCLSGELKVRGATYLIDGGDFFEIADDYLRILEVYVNGMRESNLVLPESGRDETEGAYNERAAATSDKYLLLDKETVRTSTHTTPIEICDILTDDRQFVHVKRKLGSSSLSHLFAQGVVSADLFLMSAEYRDKAKERIKRAEAGGARFSSFDVQGINSTEYQIVYAIIANWHGRTLVQALPFFSKVNLRRQAEQLRRMGYKVEYKRIKVND